MSTQINEKDTMTTTTRPGLKVVRLTAENVKRLKAVEITPDQTMQIITGRNAQGKTSVLDAIWLALGGGSAAKGTTRPIRDGETNAAVTVDLGDLTVTRTWTGDKTSLVVKSADGAKYSSPQRMLDDLVGQLSFDPLAFTRLTAREQLAALLDLVDLDVDLDTLDAERRDLYEQRVEIGRHGKAIGDIPAIDETLPTAEVSASAIIAELREAEESNRLRRLAESDHAEAVEWVDRLRRQLAEAEASLARLANTVASCPAYVDTAGIEARLTGAEDTNRRIRANTDARALLATKAEMRDRYEALTAQIDSIDHRKAEALAAAEFPVDGLGFDESGVTYRGVPFAQASSAEQIRISLAMAMALNPRLRVIRILDGSLLDEDSMTAIRDQVAARDFQVWIERVADPAESAVVIEDGQVAAP
ncbi:AAA family ATPase [Tessaracoccus sp. MC1627]|uniref:ATP-binding protein n=1 Tax=Tessaracoccus sp. MC1627 TaxID=2760312 RepID=UPI0015FEDF19|nr:AAA family ATPase [Tessaracoccus sp. MC1627]MBB1512013.1 AAA family ATPase [Tessaracoccus sp. MC1627]